MPGTTSPDNLVFPIVGDTASPRTAVTQLADSVQVALNGIHASANQQVNFYGPTASIGSVSPAPKQGDTYRESDGLKRLWIYTGTSWITNEGGLYLIRPASVSGTGVTVAADGSVNFAANTPEVQINGCFTSRFKRYRILVTVESASVDTDVFFALRNAGAVVGSGQAYWVRVENTQTAGPTRSAATAQGHIGVARAGAAGAIVNYEVQNPAHAQRKFVKAESFSTDMNDRYGGGQIILASAADGFSFGSESAATVTGSLKIYGYA